MERRWGDGKVWVVDGRRLEKGDAKGGDWDGLGWKAGDKSWTRRTSPPQTFQTPSSSCDLSHSMYLRNSRDPASLL